MSKLRVEEFFIHASNNVHLLGKLHAAENPDEIIGMARNAGFVFSHDDLLETAPRLKDRSFVRTAQHIANNDSLSRPVSGNADVFLRPIDDGDGDPPPGINDVFLESYRVTPALIRPKGGGAVISWAVNVPAGFHPTITINEKTVGVRGSMSVDPIATKTYWLSASVPGHTRLLGSVTLTVDNTGCTMDKDLGLSLIEIFSQGAAMKNFGGDGQTLEVSGVSATVQMQSNDDLTVTYDSGMILYTINLTMTLAGFSGGSITGKVWVRPFAYDGQLKHLVDHSDTSYTLPPGIWVLAVFGGPTWIAIMAVLQEIIRSKINPYLSDAIGNGFDGFGIFFPNLISVAVIPPAGDAEAILRGQLRKPECL